MLAAHPLRKRLESIEGRNGAPIPLLWRLAEALRILVGDERRERTPIALDDDPLAG